MQRLLEQQSRILLPSASLLIVNSHIPEPVLWHVFELLVEDGLVMQQGAVDGAIPNWLQIVHRDLKPAQVFLDAPRRDRYPRYPHSRMGDFGFAFFTYEDDPSNPRL